MSPQDMVNLMQVWQSGGISFQTLYEQFARGGRTREGVDYGQELADIKDEEDEKRQEFMDQNGGMTPEQAAAEKARQRLEQMRQGQSGDAGQGQGQGQEPPQGGGQGQQGE